MANNKLMNTDVKSKMVQQKTGNRYVIKLGKSQLVVDSLLLRN